MYIIYLISGCISWEISCPLKPSIRVLLIRSLPGSRIIREWSLSSSLVHAFPPLRKISPWTRFEFAMLPASWAPTRSYPLQLQPPLKVARTFHRRPTNPIRRGNSPRPANQVRSAPILISSVDHSRAEPPRVVLGSCLFFQLLHGFRRVSCISETVSTVSDEERAKPYLRDPDVALAEFLEYSSSAANSAMTLMSRIYLIYLSTRSQCCTRIRYELLLLSPCIYIREFNRSIPVYFGEKCLR